MSGPVRDGGLVRAGLFVGESSCLLLCLGLLVFRAIFGPLGAKYGPSEAGIRFSGPSLV